MNGIRIMIDLAFIFIFAVVILTFTTVIIINIKLFDFLKREREKIIEKRKLHKNIIEK